MGAGELTKLNPFKLIFLCEVPTPTNKKIYIKCQRPADILWHSSEQNPGCSVIDQFVVRHTHTHPLTDKRIKVLLTKTVGAQTTGVEHYNLSASLITALCPSRKGTIRKGLVPRQREDRREQKAPATSAPTPSAPGYGFLLQGAPAPPPAVIQTQAAPALSS